MSFHTRIEVNMYNEVLIKEKVPKSTYIATYTPGAQGLSFLNRQNCSLKLINSVPMKFGKASFMVQGFGMQTATLICTSPISTESVLRSKNILKILTLVVIQICSHRIRLWSLFNVRFVTFC